MIMTNIFPGGKVIYTSIGIITSFLRDATSTMHEDTMTIVTRKSVRIDGYLSRKVSFWLFKIFEIQKGRTFNFNGILRLCTLVSILPYVVGLTRDINRFSHVPVEPFWDASHAYHCFISSHDSGVGST